MVNKLEGDVLDDYPDLPPFPTDIPIAPLPRISLGKLLQNDEAATEQLYTICKDLGFFYLYLNDSDAGKSLLNETQSLFSIQDEVFDRSLEDWKPYDFKERGTYLGYKAKGAAIVDYQGNVDRNESFAISKDDLLGTGERLPAPPTVDNHRDLLASFARDSHSVTMLILRILNDKLKLPEGTLQSFHKLESPSGDAIRFNRVPAQPIDDRRTSMGGHSDFGSVTVLFNRLGGLQILPPGTPARDDSKWLWVRPLPNHCIINLGDALVKFTNGLLRSNIHRVMAPPGDQGDLTRYSVIYFSKPLHGTLMKRLDGSDVIPPLSAEQIEEDISSQEWGKRRLLGPRLDLHQLKDMDWQKIRGTEKLSQRLKV
ncbi:1-aminocyclopropane-1-carboxylate oxidase [Penicillium chermesinum]|uniref:1-aminocyclopropane-1-carboxylate oxidase n=1 Tax=Penicillium chermesinum TaxID=63820 RepID=A0A9W9TRE6_9EURO|nr:1-aminocyclopropane-1-carboxylate oxidase [Penicillium chermesinum]KAJ5238357.1 1-aminocyclopropane-1-carboxylate oxidase [Penicillium chermesinum]KAJ6164024.1 1-aminocyclopropane-1-carboxylate oxidase [Penicillium chermesinum]